MSSVVMDASALLAFIYDEPGAQVVADHLDAEAMISAVSRSEVAQKLGAKGGDPEQLGEWVLALGLRVEPFERIGAYAAAALYAATVRSGLSLGDRACLTLAMLRGVPVLTADRAWSEIPDLGIAVTLIR